MINCCETSFCYEAIVIKPKTHLCNLNEIKVVRHVDFLKVMLMM